MALGIHEAVWSIGSAVWDSEGAAVLTFRTCSRDPVTETPVVVSFVMEVEDADLIEKVGCQECGHERRAPKVPWPDAVRRMAHKASRN